MKKKLHYAIILLSFVMLCTSCTLHFKGENIELDSTAPKVGNGIAPVTEKLYCLTSVDLVKSDNNKTTSRP